METVLEHHAGPSVLEAAARTSLSLSGGATASSATARDARDSVVQSWVDQLTALLGDALKVRGTVTL